MKCVKFMRPTQAQLAASVCQECDGAGWLDKDIEYADGLVAALVECTDCDGTGEGL